MLGYFVAPMFNLLVHITAFGLRNCQHRPGFRNLHVRFSDSQKNQQKISKKSDNVVPDSRKNQQKISKKSDNVVCRTPKKSAKNQFQPSALLKKISKTSKKSAKKSAKNQQKNQQKISKLSHDNSQPARLLQQNRMSVELTLDG